MNFRPHPRQLVRLLPQRRLHHRPPQRRRQRVQGQQQPSQRRGLRGGHEDLRAEAADGLGLGGGQGIHGGDHGNRVPGPEGVRLATLATQFELVRGTVTEDRGVNA